MLNFSLPTAILLCNQFHTEMNVPAEIDYTYHTISEFMDFVSDWLYDNFEPYNYGLHSEILETALKHVINGTEPITPTIAHHWCESFNSYKNGIISANVSDNLLDVITYVLGNTENYIFDNVGTDNLHNGVIDIMVDNLNFQRI